jgi:hypothetical protein
MPCKYHRHYHKKQRSQKTGEDAKAQEEVVEASALEQDTVACRLEVARSGASAVRAADPIRVGVGNEGGVRRGVELKSVVEGATDITKDPLDEVEVT